MLSLGKNWAFPDIWPRQISLENWLSLWQNGNGLGGSLLLSLGLSLSVATIATATGFWGSRVISLQNNARRWLLLAYLPYVFAPVILAACLQYFFVRFHLSGKVGGILLAQILITFPFAVLFFSSFWNERLRNMEELVATLGGSTRQAMRLVVLPIAKGPIVICFFQTFLISWFEYGLTMLLGVGKVQTLTVQVFQLVTEANIFLAAMAACLLFIPPLILLGGRRKILRLYGMK